MEQSQIKLGTRSYMHGHTCPSAADELWYSAKQQPTLDVASTSDTVLTDLSLRVCMCDAVLHSGLGNILVYQARPESEGMHV